MFNEQDLLQAKILKLIINSASFTIKGDAVNKTASALLWLDSLQEKIQEAIIEQKKEGAPKIKKIENGNAK